jgi:hypothetical protein
MKPRVCGLARTADRRAMDESMRRLIKVLGARPHLNRFPDRWGLFGASYVPAYSVGICCSRAYCLVVVVVVFCLIYKTTGPSPPKFHSSGGPAHRKPGAPTGGTRDLLYTIPNFPE